MAELVESDTNKPMIAMSEGSSRRPGTATDGIANFHR